LQPFSLTETDQAGKRWMAGEADDIFAARLGDGVAQFGRDRRAPFQVDRREARACIDNPLRHDCEHPFPTGQIPPFRRIA
jgi:hypothetical protein